MSAENERIHVTPSTSGDRVPSETSNNRLLPPDSGVTSQPPDKNSPLPSHRAKCVKCGCPGICCSSVGLLIWVLVLLLVQGGPIAVLYMDHHYSDKYGSTLSRYQAVKGIETVLCTTVGIYSVNITGKCKDGLVSLPCLRVNVAVYPSSKVTPIANSTRLLKSEREFVAPKWNNECFNLDICEIDSQDTWTEYRRQISENKQMLEAKRKNKQSFLCYYNMVKKGYKEYPIVVLEIYTKFGDFFLWFVLPIATLGACWISIMLVCYWFCYPCDRETESTPREYHEINTIDRDRSDYSLQTPVPGSGGGGGMGADEGGWPTRGPSDGDTGNWPLYWR